MGRSLLSVIALATLLLVSSGDLVQALKLNLYALEVSRFSLSGQATVSETRLPPEPALVPSSVCCDLRASGPRRSHLDYLQAVACIVSSLHDCAATALNTRVFEPSFLAAPLQAYMLGHLYRIADPSDGETVRVWSYFPTEIAGALVVQARALARAGRFQDAERRYLLATRVQAQGPTAYAELGALYERSERIDDAMEAYRQAIAMGVVDANVYMTYGWWLFENKKEPDLAKGVFEQGLVRNPAYPWLMIRIGHVYRSQGEYAVAAAWYTRAVELARNDGFANLYAGLNFVEWKRYDLAIQYLSRASEISPDWPLPYYYSGKALMGSGNYDHARLYFRRAIELAGTGAEWYYYSDLSEAALDDHDCPEAFEALSTAMRLEPTAPLGNQKTLLELQCGR